MTQLLIYETVVPVSAERHRNACVEIGDNYRFTSKVNALPLMAVEFPPAAQEYAIVFAGQGDGIMPTILLGFRPAENLYISAEDHWDAGYKPAFVRRYPFVFSPAPDGTRLILCIDEAFTGLNHDDRGEKLFDAEGKPTAFVDGVLKFSQEFHAQFLRTQAFCKRLKDLNLLEEVQAQVELPSHQKIALRGFSAVNRAKLKGLPVEQLVSLVKTDELELIYLHLQSLRNLSLLSQRLSNQRDKGAA